MRKLLALAVVLTALPSMGAQVRTTNFHVHAADPQVAQLIGQWAEHYRKEKALLWLGREMPNWPERCPLHVRVTMSSPGGATSFNFMNGHVWQTMNIEGPLDRILVKHTGRRARGVDVIRIAFLLGDELLVKVFGRRPDADALVVGGMVPPT